MDNDKKRGPYGGMGGFLDDSLDEDQIKLILMSALGRAANADAFIDWLRRALSNFRNLRDIRRGLPTLAQDQLIADGLEADVTRLLRSLAELSPTLANRLHADLSKQGLDEISGITGKLTALQFSLIRVGVELRDIPKPSRGRKSDALRDQFLKEVAERISAMGVSKSQSSSVAAEVLNACDVRAPDGGRTRPDKRAGKK